MEQALVGEQIIYLKTNFKSKEFYDNGLWKLTINREKRGKSKLENPQTNNLELYVDFLSACINHFQKICELNNLDELSQKEFIKVIYYYLKEEVTTNRNTSKILSTIISTHFKIDEFKTLVQEEINEINSYTFINSYLLEYLKQLLQVKSELSIDVIRAIIMCADYEKIREANYKILEKNSQFLSIKLSNVTHRIKMKILTRKEKIKELRKVININLFKLLGFIGSLSYFII